MSTQPYYAVARGKEGPAIYRTWPECKEQVIDFKNARYKKFPTEKEAKEFIEKENNSFKSPWKKDEKTSNKNNSKHPNKNKRSLKDSDEFESLKKLKSSEENTSSSVDTSDATVAPKDTAIVYTDGACINNGRHNAKAGIGVYWGPKHKDNVSERLKGRQTNNCAEIQAAVRAVQQAKARGYSKLIIRTDSKFMIQSINEWVPKWIKNDWKTSEKKDVINKTDFLQLLDAMEGINVKWEKVKAHCGIHGNEMADKLASEGLRK